MRDGAGDRAPDDDGYPRARRQRANGGQPAGFGVPGRSGGRPGQARSVWRRKSGSPRPVTSWPQCSRSSLWSPVSAATPYTAIWKATSPSSRSAACRGGRVYGAQNILVLGSQIRAGQHGKFFGIAAGSSIYTSNSDNLLVVHLDPTHTHATILSIPRDTFVYEPGCKARNHFVGYGILAGLTPTRRANDHRRRAEHRRPYLRGEDRRGPDRHQARSFRRVQLQLVPHHGGRDRAASRSACPPGPGYHDRASNLNLKPGRHLLTTTRRCITCGTGTSSATVPMPAATCPGSSCSRRSSPRWCRRSTPQGLLSNIPKLLSIANTATKALTVDEGLGSITSLLRLARSLAHLKPRNVTLVTMPTTMDTYEYPKYSAHLMTVAAAGRRAVRDAAQGPELARPPAHPAPAKVQVRVVNGTGRGQPGGAHRSQAASARLRRGRHQQTVPIPLPPRSSYAGIAQADAAYTVMTALTTFPAGQNTAGRADASQIGTPGPVTLTLGADFAGVKAPAPQPGKSTAPARRRALATAAPALC